MRPTLTLLALVVSTSALANPTWEDMQGAPSWDHVATKNHKAAGEVSVYKADIAGITCYKGVAETEAPADLLLDIVLDVESSKRWSTAGVREAVELGRSGEQIDYYQYLDVPGWTMSSDRFWFLHGTVERGAPDLAFHWSRMEEGSPYDARRHEVQEANPKAIEPPVNVGGWIFRPNGDGTEVRYHVCTDVGGSLPKAVQNAATKGTLPDTVGDLIAEAKRR